MSNRILPLSISRDVIFGGDGLVSGTTKIDSAPDVPVSRRVRLFDGKTAELVREDWSKTDGTYIFNGIDRSSQRKYFVTSHDHTEAYNAVIADRIAAEPMEAQTPSGAIIDAFDSGASDGVAPASLAYWDTLRLHFESADDLGDPHWSNVVLAMHMDGANNGVSFPDLTGKTVTVTGNTKTITATKKFGTASAYFDGTGDYLSLADSADFEFGSGDFSIEGWFYVAAASAIDGDGVRRATIVSKDANGSRGFTIQVTDNGSSVTSTRLTCFSTNTTFGFVTNNASLAFGEFHHFYAGRGGSNLYLAINGVMASAATAVTIQETISLLRIGGTAFGPVNYEWTLNGYIDDLRITKGVARHTADFTVPSEPFHDGGALGSAAISPAQSKFGGNSLALDGAGDYVSMTGQAFGTNNLTVECWARITTIASGFAILETRGAAADATGFLFFVSATGKLSVTTNNVTTAGTTTLAANTWYHVALVRSFGTLRGYLEGVQEFSVANSANLSLTAWRIGHNFNASGTYSAGYIDELRVTNGVGRYIATFTPPSAAFPD